MKRKPSKEEPSTESPSPSIGAIAALTGIAWLGLVAAVYILGTRGGEVIDGLEEAVGEVLSSRADAMARGYRFDEAIATYEQALEAGFENEPGQRLIALRSLGALLEEQKRLDEALVAAKTGHDLKWDYPHTYLALFRLLRATDRDDEALALAENQARRAEAASNLTEHARALAQQGEILMDRSDSDSALALFRRSYDVEPSPNAALKIAQVYCAQGAKSDAVDYLESVVRGGSPRERRAAKGLARKYGLSLAMD